ncbi:MULTISPECIES: hypothetical protein [Vibrio]|uniref:Uncharacterized protein n=1 Tax=Vibrio ruber (strain DSM 16370 / JCM 11486 / BCRC 17186 / CECT 7878 / LMG 23124 / VR1) TaxID=1123498 RepID=A0A1R4LNV2_VIBR1|nr:MULTISPECIES: hypothetical protein [Vibrio]SJN58148.1 hypothetical protein VR7878_02679 [Vibrio ruber DSM 16370]
MDILIQARTAFKAIQLLSDSSLNLSLTIPLDAPGDGGYLYIFENRAKQYVVKHYLTKEEIRSETVVDCDLNLQDGQFTIFYGPTWDKKSADDYAASCQLTKGDFSHYEGSSLSLVNVSDEVVACEYETPKGSFKMNSGKSKIVVRAGEVLGRGKNVSISRVLDDNEDSGLVNVPLLNDEKLTKGEIYNVVLTLYSVQGRVAAGVVFRY